MAKSIEMEGEKGDQEPSVPLTEGSAPRVFESSKSTVTEQNSATATPSIPLMQQILPSISFSSSFFGHGVEVSTTGADTTTGVIDKGDSPSGTGDSASTMMSRMESMMEENQARMENMMEENQGTMKKMKQLLEENAALQAKLAKADRSTAL